MRTIILAIAFAVGAMVPAQAPQTNYVYICTGPSATTYHKTDECKGLNKCSREIKMVSIDKAKKMGRRPCKFCY